MIRRRKNRVPRIIDSSEDDNPQLRKRFKSCKTQNQKSANNNSRKRRIRRRENHGWSSDSSSVLRPKKRVNKFPIISSEESSSSDDEEVVHPARRGALRELSDYETGYSSDKTADTSPGHYDDVIEYRERSDYVHISIPNREEGTGKSRNGKILKKGPVLLLDSHIMAAAISSGLPSQCSPTLVSNQSLTSSEESDDEPIIRPNKNNGSYKFVVKTLRTDIIVNSNTEYSDVPSTSTNSSPIQQQAGRSQESTSADTDLDSSDESTLSNGRAKRHISGYDTDDSLFPNVGGIDENFQIKNSVRLSDSSDESEYCSICLTRFTSQEIGIPGNCNHCFCVGCIQEWAKNNNSCPIDRKRFHSIIVRIYKSHDTIRKIMVPPATLNMPWDEELMEAMSIINYSDDESISTTGGDSNDNDDTSDYDGPDEVCCVCFESGGNGNMILCDFCYKLFHLACINPPLRLIPANDWFCPDCVRFELLRTSSSEYFSE